MISPAHHFRVATLVLSLAALAACTSVDLKEPAQIEKRDSSSASGIDLADHL